MKKSIISIFLFLLCLGNVYLEPLETKSHTIKEYDTLESIAYSEYKDLVSDNENEVDTIKRWILIYNENKENLSPAFFKGFYSKNFRIEIYDFNTDIFDFNIDPFVPLEVGQIIEIPIYKEYPSVKLLDIDINKIRFEAYNNTINKYMDSSFYKQSMDNAIPIKIVYELDENGSLKEVNRINSTELILTDGTLLPSTSLIDFNLYPYKIVQNAEAKKTVFLLPEHHIDIGNNRYLKFLLIQAIADANFSRTPVVLLESMDNEVHKTFFNEYKILRNDIQNLTDKIDIFKGLTSGYNFFDKDNLFARAGINPTMAFYYYNNNCQVLGAEEQSLVDNQVRVPIGQKYKTLKNRDKYISESFSSIDSNSIIFMGIGAAHINNQIEFAEENNYNLVVFYHPSLQRTELVSEYERKIVLPEKDLVQDYMDHRAILLDTNIIYQENYEKKDLFFNINQSNFVNKIISSIDYFERMDDIKTESINQNIELFLGREFYNDIKILDIGQIMLISYDVQKTGNIVSIIEKQENSCAITHYFIPNAGLPLYIANELEIDGVKRLILDENSLILEIQNTERNLKQIYLISLGE